MSPVCVNAANHWRDADRTSALFLIDGDDHRDDRLRRATQTKATRFVANALPRVGGEASIAATISPPSANGAALSISSPRCYRTASPMLACLGIVRNAGRKPLRDIMLTVGFSRADGDVAGEHVFGLEQGRIEGNASAPYRFFPPARRAEGMTIDIGLVEAQLAVAADVALTLENERGEYFAEKERYQLTALIRNEGAQPARDIRMIVKLENADGAIVGYRAVDIAGDLSIGETRELDLTVNPIRGQATARHRVALEALTARRP